VATNDVLLAIQGNDFFTLADLLAPTGGPGGWTQVTAANGDGGENGGHLKVWWTVVVSGGVQTVTFNFAQEGEEKGCALYALTGADTANPIDGAAGGSGTADENLVAPSITVAGTDTLLVNAWQSGGGSTTASFTDPAAPWTRQYELQFGGLSALGGRQALVAAGATGTRTAVAASAVPYASSSVGVRSATAVSSRRAPVLVAPGQAARHAGTW
jgi:hypothetical protein